jgi:hypothetical protein
MTISTLPAAIDALVYDLLPVVPALRGVTICDGAALEDVADDVVAVGLAPDDVDIDAETMTTTIGDGLGEDYEIMCVVRSWVGGGQIRPRRLRAFELLTAVHDTLRANRKLAVDGSPTVIHAHISRWKYLPIVAQSASVVSLVFWIHCSAHPDR